MGRGRRSRWRTGVGLVALLALAGCGIVPPGIDDQAGRTPASTAGSDQSDAPQSPGASDPGEGSTTSTPLQPRADLGYRLPRLGPGTAPGLVARLAAMAAPDFAVVVRWATPAGVTAFGDALDARFADLARGAAAAHGVAWTPGVDIAPGGVGSACAQHPLTPPTGVSLTVDCQIVAAAGSVVGERISVLRRDGRSAAPLERTAWYADVATGEFGDGSALYRPGAEHRVLALLAEGLRDGGFAPTTSDPFAALPPEAARTMLADTVVTADDFVVQVPLEPTPDGLGRRLVSVLVPARLLAPFLSPFGAAVHAAVAGGAPFRVADAPAAADPIDCTLVACASITFDDGPTSLTDGLIDLLHEWRAPATFYLQGVNVEKRPEVAKRLVAEGHELGNHTWNHPALTKLPDPEVRAQVKRTQTAIAAATGVTARSLRPPYGDVDKRVRGVVGLPIVLWDVDTLDWTEPGSEVVAERAVGESSRGSIVLMHDTHSGTVAAVPDVVDGLRDRGFTLATVTEQFGGTLPAAGQTVSHGPR
ncbi:polysaccharide deacetylase family protein [Agromyces sp. SYSU K20354]|uniref:polysaccharide deacetylase family protein n=1 Tax=Agromyces cavernae TaxID=2898659 RepID=UPI001E2C9EFC|nr:polysaccharide deacetylase family protein [Agromyces cavernae]MCD2441110.1 polysaccharide deacetylase family protein [Agromyces cavernae]